MTTLDTNRFRTLVDDVARGLVATEHQIGGSFIRTPLLYPSGATVVVRLEEGGNDRFFVSDWGFGYQEADMIGAGNLYARNARTIAEAAGVRFDNQSFFILEAGRSQLAGAVVTIGNCSQEAAIRAFDALTEKSAEKDKDALYERLVRVFDRKAVSKNVVVAGASSIEYHVAALVQPGPAKSAVIFEPVAKHHSSVAHASMKFRDIALVPDSPRRVALVHRKAEFGPLLTVLAQAADVVDDSSPNETLLRLVKAA